MLAFDMIIMTLAFVAVGMASQDAPMRQVMRYGAMLALMISMFELQVEYGFTTILGALFAMLVFLFVLFLLLDVIRLISLALGFMRKRRVI
jgi:hypothetical protein